MIILFENLFLQHYPKVKKIITNERSSPIHSIGPSKEQKPYSLAIFIFYVFLINKLGKGRKIKFWLLLMEVVLE